MESKLQFDGKGKLRHLLTLEGVPGELYAELFARADSMLDSASRIVKGNKLAGQLAVTAFFEPSTRTQLSFEIAVKSLGAEVVSFDIANSSLAAKGESLSDTILTIVSMGTDFIIVRLGLEGELAKMPQLMPDSVALVSGGEGRNDHPSQGLLDVWTIKKAKGDFADLRVAIIGDISHSRVARSLLHALGTLGTKEMVLSGPPHLVPEELALAWGPSTSVEHDVRKAVAGADVIYTLRFQYERMAKEAKERTRGTSEDYLIDSERLALAAPDAIVMHPGPINREVEISSDVADGSQSLIRRQISHGVVMRMAILSLLARG